MKTLLTLFFLIGSGFTLLSEAQIRSESSDFDRMYKENMIEYTYMRSLKLNGEKLSRDERRSVMMRYPESAQYFKQAENMEIALIPLSVGVLSTWFASMERQRRLGDLYDSNRDGWIVATTSLSVGFILLTIISESKVRKAVNAYNKEVLREKW